MSEEITQATERFKEHLESGFYRDRNGKPIVVKEGMSEEMTREQAIEIIKRDYVSLSVIEDIKADIIEHAYLVCYDKNSIEKGMTLTGIMQAFDKHISGKESE